MICEWDNSKCGLQQQSEKTLSSSTPLHFALGSSQANDKHIGKAWQKGMTADKPPLYSWSKMPAASLTNFPLRSEGKTCTLGTESRGVLTVVPSRTPSYWDCAETRPSASSSLPCSLRCLLSNGALGRRLLQKPAQIPAGSRTACVKRA